MLLTTTVFVWVISVEMENICLFFVCFRCMSLLTARLTFSYFIPSSKLAYRLYI